MENEYDDLREDYENQIYDDDDCLDEDDLEISGYECLGCGADWDVEDCSEGDPCPACGAIALSPISF